MVQVTADSEDISNKSDSFFKDFDLVVATNCSADQLVGSKKLFLYIHVMCLHKASSPELCPLIMFSVV